MDRPRDFVRCKLPRLLYRVGWAANPLALRPWKTIDPDREALQGRFDDPYTGFRTIYMSATPEAALREKILDQLRREKATLARISGIELNDGEDCDTKDRALVASLEEVPQSLLRDFVLTTAEVVDDAEVVDATAVGSLDAYFDVTNRRIFVDDILAKDNTDHSRAFGSKVFNRGFAGVVYPSRHGSDLINYALFESGPRTDELMVQLRQIDVQPLDETCEPLRRVANDLGLALNFPQTFDTRALWVRTLFDRLSKLGEVNWYERAPERGVRYYSMRRGGAKISIITFASTNSIEVDAVTANGSAHVIASTSTDHTEVLRALAEQDDSLRAVLEPLLV